MPFRLIQRKRQEFVHTRNWVNQHTSQSALKNSGIPFIAHIGKNYDDMADQQDLRLLLFGLQQIHEKHWLRKLAHGRELYLIPTVEFAMELLSHLRNRRIDLDRVSQAWARQDGKTLDKTSNTKFAARLIAEHSQRGLPLRSRWTFIT